MIMINSSYKQRAISTKSKIYFTQLILVYTSIHVASFGHPSVMSCLNTSRRTGWNLSTNGT